MINKAMLIIGFCVTAPVLMYPAYTGLRESLREPTRSVDPLRPPDIPDSLEVVEQWKSGTNDYTKLGDSRKKQHSNAEDVKVTTVEQGRSLVPAYAEAPASVTAPHEEPSPVNERARETHARNIYSFSSLSDVVALPENPSGAQVSGLQQKYSSANASPGAAAEARQLDFSHAGLARQQPASLAEAKDTFPAFIDTVAALIKDSTWSELLNSEQGSRVVMDAPGIDSQARSKMPGDAAEQVLAGVGARYLIMAQEIAKHWGEADSEYQKAMEALKTAATAEMQALCAKYKIPFKEEYVPDFERKLVASNGAAAGDKALKKAEQTENTNDTSTPPKVTAAGDLAKMAEQTESTSDTPAPLKVTVSTTGSTVVEAGGLEPGNILVKIDFRKNKVLFGHLFKINRPKDKAYLQYGGQ